MLEPNLQFCLIFNLILLVWAHFDKYIIKGFLQNKKKLKRRKLSHPILALYFPWALWDPLPPLEIWAINDSTLKNRHPTTSLIKTFAFNLLLKLYFMFHIWHPPPAPLLLFPIEYYEKIRTLVGPPPTFWDNVPLFILKASLKGNFIIQCHWAWPICRYKEPNNGAQNRNRKFFYQMN